ncbi:MAG: hypothetical protein ACUZ8H_01725 [Candidatus Anammoxibacter sp.]
MIKLIRLVTSHVFLLMILSLSALSAADESFLSLAEKGYGTVSGKIQYLTMGRIRDGNDAFGSFLGGDAHSGSLALTTNYVSPVFKGFSLGLQYVHSEEIYSEGNFDSDRKRGIDNLSDDSRSLLNDAFRNRDFSNIGRSDFLRMLSEVNTDNNRKSPAYNLSNSGFSKLNNAFIRYDFGNIGLRNTRITIGRQSLDLTFATKYNIRQKDQAFEAIVFETSPIDDLAVTIGHLSKFSSWTSRDDLNDGSTSNKFIDVANVESVPYNTKGFQFIETRFTGIPNTILTVYDYFGHDLYNTFGFKVDYTVNPYSTFIQYNPKLHYIKQWDVGRFAGETGTPVSADVIQAGLKMTKGNFSIEPGIFWVAGDGPENTLHTPFQPAYIIEEPLFEVDIGFEGGSFSYFIESSYAWGGKNSLYFLFLQTEHRNNLSPSGFSREFNLIYSRDITEKSYFKIKLGTVEYENDDSVRDGWLDEYRFFLGYRF